MPALHCATTGKSVPLYLREKKPAPLFPNIEIKFDKMGAKTGPEIALEAFGASTILHSDHDIETQKDADELAAAHLGAQALEFITSRGSCIGLPTLKARMVIEVKDVGVRFSGKYYVTSVTHTIDSAGYRTDFEAKRNAR